jgi:hypothetical protein
MRPQARRRGSCSGRMLEQRPEIGGTRRMVSQNSVSRRIQRCQYAQSIRMKTRLHTRQKRLLDS